MYYELIEDREKYKNAARIGTYPELPRRTKFTVGKRITLEAPLPLRFELDPDYGPDLGVFMGSEIPVMRKDLIAALREAGVDNLDTYDAVIYDPVRKRESHDYQAVNIIGLVAAADLGASEYESFGEAPRLDAVFARTVIDEKRAGGALMFRMQESVMTVMVHERVKRAIESKFPTLWFIGSEKTEAAPDDDDDDDEE